LTLLYQQSTTYLLLWSASYTIWSAVWCDTRISYGTTNFNIFIIYLCSVVRNSTCQLFVDDTNIFREM